MVTRESHPFTISGECRRPLGVELAAGHTVVATLTGRPRAQMTPEERTALGSGGYKYQWGLGIGRDPCNLFYVMHESTARNFATAHLVVRFKENATQTTSDQCHNNGYQPAKLLYEGPDLGVMVVERSVDGASLIVRAYDYLGETVLCPDYLVTVPAHWGGVCGINLRGDNCLADGVITT